MEALQQQTQRLIREVQHHDLAQYEKLGDGAYTDDDLSRKLEHIRSQVDRLEMLAGKEPPSQRHQAKYRVTQLAYELRHLSATRDHIRAKRAQRELAERQREELLTRRFVANDEDDTSIAIDDYMLAENDKLQATGRSLDDFISTGQMVLESFREQGMGLKGTRRRMLDIANTLGMSNTVMRLIEKRGTQDKIIMAVGMVVTCIIMYIVIKFFA